MKMTGGNGQARKKIKIKRGRGAAAAATSGEGEERVRVFSFLGFFFCCLPSNCKITPLCVLKAAIYRQNIVWASKLVPQLSFFFVNFNFSYFFVFFENEQYQRRFK
jgi:hypothetical protein